MRLNVVDLGRMEFDRARCLQENLAAQIARGERAPTLLLLEHDHVYTFGRSGHAENLLLDSESLHARGIAVHWVDRGGDITYHGPGQLVGYPLLPLGSLTVRPQVHAPADAALPPVPAAHAEYAVPRADYVGFIRLLESAIIVALARLGVVAAQRSGMTGVWVQPDVWSRCRRCRPEQRLKPAKLASIGIKVDAQGVSRHGFALNVDPDMSYWDGIVGCGIPDQPMAALSDLLDPVPTMAHVKSVMAEALGALTDTRPPQRLAGLRPIDFST